MELRPRDWKTATQNSPKIVQRCQKKKKGLASCNGSYGGKDDGGNARAEKENRKNGGKPRKVIVNMKELVISEVANLKKDDGRNLERATKLHLENK